MNCCTSLAILVCIQLAFTGNLVWGQGCLKASKSGSDATDPPFNDDNNEALPADNNVQAIITTYKFHQDCGCVNITTWETYVQPGGGGHANNMAYDITFQVWRPSPTVTDAGCYSLVGQNAFTSFAFSNGGFVQLSPTPPTQAFIIAQPGDVVGYYTNSRRGNDDGIQLEHGDFTVNTIWYLNLAGGSPAPGTNECPLSVGANGYLTSSTNAAPMLKISTSTISCPPSPTTSQQSPSSSSASLPVIQSSSYLSMILTSNPSQLSAVSTTSPDMPSSGTVNAHTIEISGPTVISLSVASTEAMSESNAAPTSRLVSSSDLSITPTSISGIALLSLSVTPLETNIARTSSSIFLVASGSGGNSAVPLIAAVVVIVVMLIVSFFLSLLTMTSIILRKKLVRDVKLDANALDLSDPIYESCMNFSQQTAQQMLDDNSISVESNVAYSTVTQNKNRSLREKLTVNDTRDEANIRCTNLSAVSEVDTEANVAYNIMIKRVEKDFSEYDYVK